MHLGASYPAPRCWCNRLGWIQRKRADKVWFPVKSSHGDQELCSAQNSSAYSQSKFNQSSSFHVCSGCFTPSLLNSTFGALTEMWTSLNDDLSAAVLQTWCQPPTPPMWTSLRWLTRCLRGPPMQAGWSFSRLSSPLITCVSMATRLVTEDEAKESDVVQFFWKELKFRFPQK